MWVIGEKERHGGRREGDQYRDDGGLGGPLCLRGERIVGTSDKSQRLEGVRGVKVTAVRG